MRIEKHRGRGGGRRGLAIVDGDVLIVFRQMDHHEAAAADIAGARISDGERKGGGDRGVDRIAAAIQDLDADARGAAFLRHHHAVDGTDALHLRNGWRARSRRDLGGGRDADKQANDDR